MAITRYSSFDTTVNTIADRNALTRKVDHMIVLVKDAIADPDAGSGKATYRWDATDSTWVLISKSTINSMSFATEELVITSGQVTLSNYPTNNQLWNLSVVDGDVIVADLRLEDLTITNNVVSGIVGYDGKELRCSYAYGSTVSQITSVLENYDVRLQTAEEILAELTQA